MIILVLVLLVQLNQLAVFSEIYYPAGWNAYIDNEPVEHIKVNYILRGLFIPLGEHTIEFKFEPKSFVIGNIISLSSSILLIILVIGTFAYYIRKELIRKSTKA